MSMPTQSNGPSLMLIEGGLTFIAVAFAFCCPRLGAPMFRRIERAFRALARHKHIAVLFVGLAALLLRLATLPWNPIPRPFVHDDFSFLLAANTFASGRLTNPTPAMWTHFESFHIDMLPTYMSMYFPAQGMLLAAGKLITGHAWFGLLAVTSLMCAAICWMLQGWLPPSWALLGGCIAILRLGLFSDWIDTYSGAASVAALGGALVLGALSRLKKTVKVRDGMLLAVGIVLLGTSRPYEGMLLCIPVAIALAWWALFGENRPSLTTLTKRAAAPLLLVVAGGAWMGYYNYRVFGNPLTLPYTINRATYAVAPYFIWQSPRPTPVYRNRQMREFYTRAELGDYEKIHSVSGFLSQTLFKVLRTFGFFAGIVLLPPLLMLRRTLADRRIRFLLLCMPLLMAGMLIEIWLFPHYLAPFTAAFYAIGLQAMRHLRLWAPGNLPVGSGIVRFTVTICVFLVVLRLGAKPLHFELSKWPRGGWSSWWYGPGELGIQRAQTEARLETMPGKQLVIVRYSANHICFDEWVYNAPDIGASKVIWARDMGEKENQELIHYYKGRNVWLVQPDINPVKISPYPLAEKDSVAALSNKSNLPDAGVRQNMAVAR